MLSVAGREFIVVCGSDWNRLVEDASDQEEGSTVPR